MLTVYTSIILAGLIGTYLSSQKNLGRLTLATLSSSTLFFLTTNTAVWAFGTMYEKSITGLLTSYTAGIPFFRNMIVGDIWFTLVLFGSYELAVLLYKKRNTKETPETVNL
jgi:formate-dependent nitrite reductase membrane component NrfD